MKTGRGEPPCLLHARIILQVNKYTQSRCLEWGRQVRRLWTGTIFQPIAAVRISVGSDTNTPLAAGFISPTFTTSSSSPLQLPNKLHAAMLHIFQTGFCFKKPQIRVGGRQSGSSQHEVRRSESGTFPSRLIAAE